MTRLEQRPGVNCEHIQTLVTDFFHGIGRWQENGEQDARSSQIQDGVFEKLVRLDRHRCGIT